MEKTLVINLIVLLSLSSGEFLYFQSRGGKNHFSF
jgi:hypothetical protein